MKKRTRNRLATWLGFLTTLLSAAVLIDWDRMDWSSINAWLKIFVALIPAVGGYLSEIKGAPKASLPKYDNTPPAPNCN